MHGLQLAESISPCPNVNAYVGCPWSLPFAESIPPCPNFNAAYGWLCGARSPSFVEGQSFRVLENIFLVSTGSVVAFLLLLLLFFGGVLQVPPRACDKGDEMPWSFFFRLVETSSLNEF